MGITREEAVRVGILEERTKATAAEQARPAVRRDDSDPARVIARALRMTRSKPLRRPGPSDAVTCHTAVRGDSDCQRATGKRPASLHRTDPGHPAGFGPQSDRTGPVSVRAALKTLPRVSCHLSFASMGTHCSLGFLVVAAPVTVPWVSRGACAFENDFGLRRCVMTHSSQNQLTGLLSMHRN
jgi:hypothetical protein